MNQKYTARSLMISGTYFPPQVGGISRMMAEICRHLGPEKIAAVSGENGEGLDSCLVGIRTYCSPAAFDQTKQMQLLHLFWLIGRAIARERPRLLQFATAEDAWIAWYTSHLTHLPHIIYAHGNEILALSRLGWQKPKDAFRKAALIIANSHFTADLVERKLGVAHDRIRTVYPGCDTQRFRPMAVPEGFRERMTGRADAYPVLLSVGNLVERKGQDLVIRALPELRKLFPKISYVIVGEGRDRKVLEELCKSMGVDDSVTFFGRGIDTELPTYYSACDLFVMPSRSRFDKDDVEGFGMVFLEAAACGKAAIGGRSGGIADAIDEGNTGLLVDPESTEDLIGAIARLIQSPETLARFGEEGRIRTNRDFTWAVNGSTIERLIGEIVSQR